MLVVRLASSFAAAAEPALQKLAAFDRDRDGVVSEAEFVAQSPGKPALWRRDFRLCDWNGDGALTPNEFAGCPTLFPALERGPWPDPLDAVLERYVALFDEHWQRWDVNQNGEMSQGEFVSGTLALSITPLKTAAVKGIDPDGNGKVTRDEARRVLELLLGYRSWNDLPLREPNGCVVDGSRFRTLDRNDDGSLAESEVLAATFPHGTAAQAWRILDDDRNGKVEFVEWRTAMPYSLADPIEDFRRLDANLDARVDSDELRSGVAESHRPLAACLLPGFDVDQDGALSLSEYRWCPLGNPVLNWHRELGDANSDGQIVFEEFLYGGGQYRLLAWEYFQHLDWNHDRFLDQNEFFFHTKQEDGTGWRRLLLPNGYQAIGSPAASPDGRLLAFDVGKVSTAAGSTAAARLCLFNLDGTLNPDGSPLRMLLDGRWPTWSPDGQSLAYVLIEGAVFVAILPLETPKPSPLGEGVGAHWSPDGKKIACSGGSSLLTYNVETKSPHVVIDAAAESPYRLIDSKMSWSPDSTQLCFKGGKDRNLQELAIVHAGGAELGFRVYDRGEITAGGIAWHPRGDRIVFSKFCHDRNRTQLYEFHPNNDDQPRLFPGQDPQRNNTDMCWTPDGTTLIVISGDF